MPAKKLIISMAFAIVIALTIHSLGASAVPSGPTITVLFNETKQAAPSRIINTTGGSITTVFLNATTQNPRWKGYVGNVTGTLTLDDANDNTLYQWSMTAITGEIYATRSSSTINWSGANCSNSTHISNEEILLNHTNKDDNITATFSAKSHRQFFIGTREILQNSCFSIRTFVNSSIQQTKFEEVMLYDSTRENNGNIVFASPLEQDANGFDNDPYDFQMIVPENGLPTWNGATAYYFYAELV